MDNKDLTAIEREIAEKRANGGAAVTEPQPVPAIRFDNPAPLAKQEKTATDTAGDLVESAFNQAVVHTVATNEDVKNELLDSAGKVIKNKTNAIKERADQEEKEAYFNNRKGACECFGYDEATTEKWAVNFMNLWHNIMTAIWILIGCFTFAPVTFVAKKIKVIFKKTWIAVTLAVLIYLMLTVGIPLLTGLLNK